MKKYLLLILIALVNRISYSQELLITGELKSFTNGIIYFTDAFEWSIPIDSAKCIKGKFTLKINNPKLIYPFQASLSYKLKDGRFKSIMFNVKSRNHYIERSSIID